MHVFLRILKCCFLMILTVSVLLCAVSCKDDYNEEYESKLARLIYEKQKLFDERDGLDSDMVKALGNTSYMSIVFVQLDSALYTDAYPAMSEGEVKIVGVMALSEDELPGGDGSITLAQYQELISVGWGNALYWDGVGELKDYLDRMTCLLENIGIALPKSVIFASGTYSLTYDAVLWEYGIENAVHSGEEELAFVEKNEPDGIWHPGRIGWRWLGKSTLLKKTVESEAGYALFEVTFDNSESSARTSFFPIKGDASDTNRVNVFCNMMASFRQSISAGEIEVYNIDDTRTRVIDYYENRRIIEAENDLRREAIDSEIRRIEAEITELYNQYH